MNIQEKCNSINEDIHNRIFINNYLNDKDYTRTFTSLDVIEDCQNAIEEFEEIPAKYLPKRTTLYIYGVLQAIYCQQDGLFHLYRVIIDSKLKEIDELFEKFDLSSKIRRVRNEIAGHPADRNKGKEFYFIAKGANSKYNFTYAGYTPEFKVVDVDLKEFIQQQSKFTDSILSEIKIEISNKIMKHKQKFKNVKLAELIKDKEGSMQLINRGINNNHPLAIVGVKNWIEKLDNLKKELNIRYNNDFGEDFVYIFKLTDYILSKMKDWIEKGQIENNIEARIYSDSFSYQLTNIENSLKQIDEEFENPSGSSLPA